MSELTNTFSSIADAIRAKNGSSDTYTPAQMATAISNIPSIEEESLTVVMNGTYNAPTGKAYNPVNVNVKGKVYGFHIDGNEDDPDSMITYLADAVGMTPAYMDYTNDKFEWGSWQDAFFIPKPCMLNKNGTVAYYLDPNDYTKKTDGTASDVADDTTTMNAMMEWGQDGKKIWWKIVPDVGDNTSASIYIADHKVDNDFVDYNFHTEDGTSSDHFYTPIYNGCLVNDGTNNVLRSISGKAIMQSKTADQELTAARYNNPTGVNIWNTETYVDNVLITLLVWLITKSTNSQAKLGEGITSGSQTAVDNYRTGTLNDKGLFYGSNGTTTAVKVFGMENFWGLQWRRYVGHLLISGVQYIKLTYGQEDGSTQNGYDFTGSGYINKGTTPTGTSGQYLAEQTYSSDGFLPSKADNTVAASNKEYCDYFYFSNSSTRVPLRGGRSSYGAGCGVSAVDLYGAASVSMWSIGASLSCKPLS